MQQIGGAETTRAGRAFWGRLVNNNFPPLVATVSKRSLPTRVSMRSAPCSDATKYYLFWLVHKSLKSESVRKIAGAPGAAAPYSRLLNLPFKSKGS
jgi:hypothetical protein